MLIIREDKLIKTVVVHNGYHPVRYYMFLFPDSPNFSNNLGEPLFLSPLIENGQMDEARHVIHTEMLTSSKIILFLKKTISSERPTTASSC